MKKFFLTFIVFLLFIGVKLNSQTTLIPYGSSWKYYDLGNEPSPISGDDWNDKNYDDNNWSSGNTHLGYGDGDEVTSINSSTITAYVRHAFNVTNPTAFDNLDFNLTYDDGAVIYLNGIEIWRVNMPTGTIDYGTYSSSTSSENAQTSQNFLNNMITGTNVLAVEIHQRSSSSSDISFDFEMVGNAPGAVNVSRGPYLQKASDNSIVIKWRTVSSTESIIDYGLSLGNLNSTVSDLTSKTEHEIEITGLQANTTYYYQIRNSNAILVIEDANLYFKTHPTPGTQTPITAWVLGDCGTANNNQRAVRDAFYNYIGNNHTDMVILLGDNAYNNGTDSEYQNAIFNNMYEDKLKNSITWSCLGNHDGYSADSDSQTGPYYDIFTFPTSGESGGTASGTEAYYSWDYGNVHFIVLDSYDSDRSVGGSMYNWCQTDIQNTTADWIVAIWHHPAYSKGSHNSDSESNLIQMRQNFLPMLEGNGVDLVLSGHSHSYERSYFINGHYGNSSSFDPNTHVVGSIGGDGQVDGTGAYTKATSGNQAGEGAVYITAGSSGKISGGNLNHNAMFYSVSALGSCVIEVDGDAMNVKFIRETGAVQDYFTIEKSLNNCTPGNTCDDGDDCTSGDIYDNNCNCTGTFQDSDGDTVCDVDDVCPGFNDLADADGDTVPDACDACPGFDDAVDSDVDGVANGCDACPGFDDNLDTDADGVADGCDACPGFDDAVDSDGDGVADGCDVCAGFDDTVDTDGDNVPDGCDACPLDSNDDSDGDGICDSNDICPGFDDAVDTDGDNVPDGCDACPLDANDDSDGDGVCDSNDSCPGFDDTIDSDGDEVANGCDACPGYDDAVDTDGDGVADGCDTCPGFDDTQDADGDGVADGCDVCAGFDDTADTDEDNVPDGCDQCPTQDDAMIGTACDDSDPCTANDIYDNNCNCAGTLTTDSDGDGVCDASDLCPGFDDAVDGDGDGVADGCDVCVGFDDTIDTDGDNVPDGCDACPLDANDDSDGDGVCDSYDTCPGFDDTTDTDGDNVPNGCDVCPLDANDDSDGDGVCDSNDTCPGFDDTIDTDGDNAPDGCDACPLDANDDSDGDGVCDSQDQCPGFDDTIDADGDGVADGCDVCPGFDDTIDTDGDNVPDGCDACPLDANDDSDGDGVCDSNDTCPGFDDTIDSDGDNVPDSCDVCPLDANNDSDGDGVCDSNDTCPGFDDTQDSDGDNVPNGCDACPLDANDDSDGDGVCDSNDTCPGFDDTIDTDGDNIPDGCDACPLDANDDSDGDGVCDSNDTCPGFDDTQDTDGDNVPDGCDVCPLDVNDDSDGDGVCDSQDQCPGQDDGLIGTACDDGIACTINDVYDSNCGCSGVIEDLDGDGFCSVNDPNDSDPCIPDAGAPNCEPCTEIYFDNFDSSWGPIWNDGGGDCERKKDNNRSYSPQHCVKIKDNSGIQSSTYTDPLNMSAYDFAEIEFTFISKDGVAAENFLLEVSTNGGSSFTTIQNWEYNVDFLENVRYWELVTINSVTFTNNTVFRIRCDAWDNDLEIYIDDIRINACALSCAPGLSCDDGDPCTINDVTDVDCGCAGVFEDSDNDAVCDYFDQCPGLDDGLIGTACDDGIACTMNDVYDSSCGCAGIYQDSDGDGVCDVEDQCPGQDDSLIGQSCDDGDDCTINDVYNGNCGCEGTPEQDLDGDGVCDSQDQCPGQDDGIIGMPCEDGDPCTTGEVYESTCNCGAGSYTDDDGDGYCIGNDPNDNDPCIPDPSAPNCNPCSELYFDNFDSSWGPIWNDGGKECQRKKDSDKAYSPEYSIKIKKDKGIISSFYTDALDLSSYEYLEIGFTFYAKDGKDQEKFVLEISTDGGSNFSMIEDWEYDVDFIEETRYWESVTINSISFSSNTVIRFRNNAVEDDLETHIDDITIIGCGSSFTSLNNENLAMQNISYDDKNIEDIKIFPNPNNGTFNIDLSVLENKGGSITIFDLNGRIVKESLINIGHKNIITLNLDNIGKGVFLLHLNSNYINPKIQRVIVF